MVKTSLKIFIDWVQKMLVIGKYGLKRFEDESKISGIKFVSIDERAERIKEMRRQLHH